ncbi:TetR/AcrR family transcriptional regulator [Streptoalloteichus hindustanus]|uniref:Transcriptional regulator, TetR family n=1 Tax=Streptoalloteichus hindustanus TaxID=2017 RepID=A0A1M5IBM4_STRHI|nr:TetR/AcrR family transcriptional regulator [Streptoalloteichus hindustanus]SHG25469.1 transcriptional regulator, TetR family [Streptoalloteichus hindustanus]
MDDPTPEPSSGPSRRRGAVLEEAILRAAVEELTESGYAGLSMDRVARRAGTNKNAIYRRWPSRAALGVAAYRRLAEVELRPPDTGELRGDVLALLRQINCDLSSSRSDILRGLLAGVGDDPELLTQLREQINQGGAGVWLTVLGRAVARGEVRPEALHPRVATVAVTLLRNEYVTQGITSVTDGVLVEIVDEVYLPLVRARGSTAG